MESNQPDSQAEGIQNVSFWIPFVMAAPLFSARSCFGFLASIPSCSSPDSYLLWTTSLCSCLKLSEPWLPSDYFPRFPPEVVLTWIWDSANGHRSQPQPVSLCFHFHLYTEKPSCVQVHLQSAPSYPHPPSSKKVVIKKQPVDMCVNSQYVLKLRTIHLINDKKVIPNPQGRRRKPNIYSTAVNNYGDKWALSIQSPALVFTALLSLVSSSLNMMTV